MNSTKNPGSKNKIDAMFSVGAHFGYIKSRRHPTTAPFIFGRKNNVEIFDLEKTAKQLEDVKAYIAGIAKTGGRILFEKSQNWKNDSVELFQWTKNQQHFSLSTPTKNTSLEKKRFKQECQS